MFFLQFPPTMPTVKRSDTADGPEVTDSSRPPGLRRPGVAHTVNKTCALNDLPAGFMGKMLVYRSGAIKLKLDDTLYDVSRSYNKTKNGKSLYFYLCINSIKFAIACLCISISKSNRRPLSYS
jgi:hypothetical protein